MADEFDEAFGGVDKPKERGFGERFKDSMTEAALHNPIGAEFLVRQNLKSKGMTDKQISAVERRLSEKLAKKREADPTFKGKDLGNFTRGAADLLGVLIGGADPTYLLGPGKTAVQRIGAQSGINAGVDAVGQGIEVERKVRDKYDPVQTGVNALVGAVFQGGQEAGRSLRLGQKMRRGAADPEFNNLTATILKLEGGGTYRNPKTSPKGAMGPMQVMPATARDPGFGIRPWNGKTQEDLARVGRQYAAVLNHRYGGDKAKVLAAYNAGPGALEKAVKRHGDDWLRHMPAETRKYVRNGVTKMGGNGKGLQELDRLADTSSRQDSEPFSDNPVLNEIYKNQLRQEAKGRTPEEEAILRDADDSNVIEFPEQDNTFIERVMRPDYNMTPEDEFRLDQILRSTTSDDVTKAQNMLNQLTPETKERLDSLLGPAERQEMDASVTGRPPAENTGYEKFTPYMEPKTPANDLDDLPRLADSLRYEDDVPSPISRETLNTLRPAIRETDGTVHVGKKGDIHMNVLESMMQKGIPDTRWADSGFVDKDGKFLTKNEAMREKGVGDASYLLHLQNDPEAFAIHDADNNLSLGQKVVKTFKDIMKDEKGSYRESPESRPVDPVEDKLMQDLKRLQPLTAKQRTLYHEERSKRASSLANLQKEGGGRENVYRQLHAAKGGMQKVKFKSIANNYSEKDFAALANKINFAKTLLPYEKLNALQALTKLLGAEGVKLPTPGEIKLLSEVYSPDFIQALLDNREFMEKFWHNVGSTINIPRALMSSVDLSAPFRQGIPLVHKKAFWKAMPSMLKIFGSERASKQLLEAIKSHPNWAKAKKGGLAIVDPHSHFLADREEAFMTDLAEKIPLGVGKLVGASNRAYSGFLNKLRFDVFNDLLSKYEAAGLVPDSKKLREIANFVNSASGRGSLGKTGNAAAPALAIGLFSPRLIASRLYMLSPTIYAKSDPILRKEAWKSLLAYSAYVGSMLSIGSQLLGWDVETDPRSPDFAKMKSGNTRVDVTGGFQTYVRLGAQLISHSKITGSGNEKELGGGLNPAADGPYDENLSDVIGRFIRSKESPIASLIHNFFAGENVVGEPFTRMKTVTGTDVKVPAELAERLLPMTLNDLAEVYQDSDYMKAIGLAPFAMLGTGVQTYSTEKKTEDDFEKAFKASFEPEASTGDEFDKAFNQ